MVRPATQGDLSTILAIYNDAVLHSTAIWNDQVVDFENRRELLKEIAPGVTRVAVLRDPTIAGP